MARIKSEIVTFKVEGELAKIINCLPNKSEFIRKAILSALDNTCPLCQGTGVLTPEQAQHWKAFTHHHPLVRCEQCDAVHLACDESECLAIHKETK